MKEKKVMKMIQEMNERNLRLLVGVQKAGTCKGVSSGEQPSGLNEEKDYLKRMVDESNKNAALDVDRQLEEFDMVKKELRQCQKERDKERNARKKAEKSQEDMMRLLKDLQRQQRDIEKKYQKLKDDTERRCQKLKDHIKQGTKKEKKDMKLIRQILGISASWTGISDSGASLKEIAADCKAFSKQRRKANAELLPYDNNIIDGFYRESKKR